MEPNTLFPGRPGYVGPCVGVFGLLHHSKLWEESHDVMERVGYVKKHKPLAEVPTRLHHMIYLGGCPEALNLAVLRVECGAKGIPLRAEYYAKRDALKGAVLAYIRTHIPDCTWDGRELVFPKDDQGRTA